MRAVEVPKWLQGLPSAPEFRPTDTEFADPIAYISKIEREASAFGICKVIPPLPKPSKKYVLYNLNRTLAKCHELGSDVDVGSVKNSENGGGEIRAAFTTRQQELGQSGKKVKGEVESHSMGGPRQVWQSGETYTLDQFETKSKTFAKSQLSTVKEVSPLVIEAMFWKATSEKPIYVEYANDVPGSGFGEPEESFQYLHRKKRRRRKRGAFYRNNRESSISKNDQVEKDNINVDKDLEVTNSSRQASSTSTCFPTDQSRTISVGLQAGNEMVGTAGWKLANSPWNLQVIARSPGSLTRFMPDDIPGVTSPMVYIGMLFSWFAWHVEDHELHSLNYLHMGSPKTWYAVPGNYAFTFEEAIRLHAYGDNTDHIDALSLLGEKTTLLSPETIVASGIPCCRLIQNPGEFVVTFPRAYHVGFSHGFNCGEAANFATPMWLSVAKEAAVRRAAMNYLPMLSHQQLLYLLTMSFISRVPRSLLPGARSSRLRDRQKEERERSVKKAFVEDILKENHLLTILLKKNPSYHVVIWDLDLLPCSSKQLEPCSKTDTIAMTSDEKDQSQDYPTQDLYSQMNCYMDSLNDFYVDDADHLLCEYQADSGTLPCVACGILGFPFMAVVQPTEQASRDLLAEDADMIQQLSTLEAVDSQSLGLNGGVEESVGVADTRGMNLLHPSSQASSSAELSQSTSSPVKVRFPGTGHSLSSQEAMGSSENTPGMQWNLSNRSLRPRVFCLEHAIQTVDLLCLRGGANVLGLCHSDFQKIKAHAAVVAEEIGSPFTFSEISLDNASQGDLCMIDHATDDQEKYESTQDWTSKLCINLQHCVKMRKNSQKVHHALGLDGLPSDGILGSNAWKWQSTRPRSKRNSGSPSLKKPSLSNQTKKVKESGVKADAERGRKEDRPIIHYYRKKYRLVSHHQEVTKTSVVTDSLPSREPIAGCVNPNRELCDGSENTPVRSERAGNGPSESSHLPSGAIPAKQDEDQVSGNPFTSKHVDSLAIAALIPQHIEAPGVSTSIQLVEKNNEGDSTFHHSEELSENLVAGKSIHKDDLADSKSSSASGDLLISSPEDTGVFKGSKIVTEINGASSTHDVVWTDEPNEQCNTQGEADVTEEASAPGNSCSVVHDTDEASVFIPHAHTETTEVDKQGTTSRLSKYSTLEGKLQEEKHMSGEGQEVPISSNAPGTYKIQEADSHEKLHGIEDIISSLENQESDGNISTPSQSEPNAETGRKRKREANMVNEVDHDFAGFIRSPCEGLRPRAKRDGPENQHDLGNKIESKAAVDRMVSKVSVPCDRDHKKGQQKKGRHRCDIESCKMSFQTKTELATHKRNRCHVEGCGKKFNSHKYAMLHQRVHEDDRPLKCTWEGCKMTFKWAWARTEHFRVHTGERPYKCKVEGCGLTFRFVSDFSRHRRKTGHYV